MSDTEKHLEEYAEAAGLRPTDMPSAHHPLMENDDEVTELADLVDVRENASQDDVAVREMTRGHNREIDVEEALTFPHKKHSPRYGDLPDVTDFDADARTHAAGDPEDNDEYMTRADVVESMNATDPDPSTGMDADEFIADDVEEYRAPGIEGTVTGIARGMSTHLPQDIGADGFQIEDPEADFDPNQDEESERHIDATRGHVDPTRVTPEDDRPGRDNLDDGGRIATRPPNPVSRDDALDATRRMR